MNKLVDAIYEEIKTRGGHCNKLSIASQIHQLDGRHGWKLVPVEPTEAMIRAPRHEISSSHKQIYGDMLAATPDPLDRGE